MMAQNAERGDSTARLQRVTVIATPDATRPLTPLQQVTLRATSTITAARAAETINLVDVEDAVKYQSSLFLRKRNNGDAQAVMATRVWGVSSSARSLVLADGAPLTALVANNNTIGGPRWGLVAPTEIERIDVMYGPFSAAYAGNSMGAVLEMTTRMPDRFTGSVTQTGSRQGFSLYGTDRTFGMSQTALTVGDRFGRFSFWLSGNRQASDAQPLTYVTAASFPAGTTGGFAASNKLNAAANVLGATGLLQTTMLNGKLKMGVDVTPTVRATLTAAWWQNDGHADAQSYLQKDGAATFASNAGFASGTYDINQRHTAQIVTVRSASRGDWDWEVVGTRYAFDHDQQRSPVSATVSGFGSAGRAAVLDGTQWSTADAKLLWHRGGPGARHAVAFGVHADRYELANTTFNTSEWTSGAFGTVSSQGEGRTRTQAVWGQDAWRVLPSLVATLGVRAEQWTAEHGRNVSGSTTVSQPSREMTRVSPKATLAWTASEAATITASLGRAYRFATVSELYQLVTTGATFTSPNPNLRPDNVLAAELRFDRRFAGGRVSAALFQDDVRDAMVAQFLPLVANSATLYSYVSNVDHVRARGVELSGAANALLRGRLDVAGSVTYVDPRILAISGRASATAAPDAAVGRMLPNIPDWRMSAVATVRPSARASLTAAARYSGKMYTTLDNADVNPNVYQGFSAWCVVDAKAAYRLGRGFDASLGVDNLLNRKYFLFHPFPQRTLVGSVSYAF